MSQAATLASTTFSSRILTGSRASTAAHHPEAARVVYHACQPREDEPRRSARERPGNGSRHGYTQSFIVPPPPTARRAADPMPTQPLELRAEPRTTFGKHVRRLRRQGIVPANIFGHGDSRVIQAPLRALEHLLAQGGRTGVVTLALNGTSQTALMKGM